MMQHNRLNSLINSSNIALGSRDSCAASDDDLKREKRVFDKKKKTIP